MSERAIEVERRGPVWTIILNRPERRNAIDGPTAEALAAAFRDFEAQAEARIAVLWGRDSFCAGADLKAFGTARQNRLELEGDGPMGPTRMQLSKPVIAAISGHAVAGGLELALFCDLRVADANAVLGVFCRRFGVPLIDGGTIRLPQLIGLSRAMDLILTGRGVSGIEALEMGLVNRLVEPGQSRAAAEELARELAALPQRCMLSDRASTYAQLQRDFPEAIADELRRGLEVIASGETSAGAQRFQAGAGRHGEPERP